MLPKTPIRTKSVWIIKDTVHGEFYMVDDKGEMQWSPQEEQSRFKMSQYAFDHGADEVRHEYDLVKYDGSGSRK